MNKLSTLMIGAGLIIVLGVLFFSTLTPQEGEFSPELLADLAELQDQPQVIESEIQEDTINDIEETIIIEKEGDEMPKPFEPIFTFEVLSEETVERISGISWSQGAPVTLDDLRLVTVSYVDFEGLNNYGELLVNAAVAEDIIDIFEELYEAQFPIGKMLLIDEYGGDDNLSMADNNCSAFNDRNVPGTDSISIHSYGLAIDINPIQNPYLPGDEVMPPAGSVYVDRSDVRPGMIVEGDLVYNAFISRGWTWGGDWHSVKDYQHFVKALD